jgi:hypothetical protein
MLYPISLGTLRPRPINKALSFHGHGAVGIFPKKLEHLDVRAPTLPERNAVFICDLEADTLGEVRFLKTYGTPEYLIT